MYFQKHLWLSLTQKCNWKCTYCDHPHIESPKQSSIEDIEKLCEMLLKEKFLLTDVEILLEGGEIGLLNLDELHTIFYSDIADKYSVTTNGLFLEKGYHNRFNNKIRYILYHISPEIYSNTPIKKYKTDIPIQYTFVVHKNNIQYIESLVDSNKDCMFLPHFLQPRREDLNFMSKDEFITIYNILQDKDNIFDFIKLRLKTIIDLFDSSIMMNKLQKRCQGNITKCIINLPCSTINRCCVSTHTASIELTQENLHSVLLQNNIFDGSDFNLCKHCISSNVLEDVYSIKNKWKFLMNL